MQTRDHLTFWQYHSFQVVSEERSCFIGADAARDRNAGHESRSVRGPSGHQPYHKSLAC